MSSSDEEYLETTSPKLTLKIEMSTSDEEYLENTPPQLEELVENAAKKTLPARSCKKYNDVYEEFLNWKTENQAITSEDCLLTYFNGLIKKYKPSTVWSRHSMIKSQIKLHEDIDIAKYHKLNCILKRNATGFESKKSKTFTNRQVNQFLDEAPDEIHLGNKARNYTLSTFIT